MSTPTTARRSRPTAGFASRNITAPCASARPSSSPTSVATRRPAISRGTARSTRTRWSTGSRRSACRPLRASSAAATAGAITPSGCSCGGGRVALKLDKRSFLKALAAIVPGVALLSRSKPAQVPLVETGPLEPIPDALTAPPISQTASLAPARDHRVNGFAGTRYDAPVFLSDEHGSWCDSDRDFAKIMREDRPMPSTEAGRLSLVADMHRHQLLADEAARKTL